MSRNGKGAFRKALALAAAEAPVKAPRVARLRRLSEEDIDLWLSVAAGVTRRPDANLPVRLAIPVATGRLPLPISVTPLKMDPAPKTALPPLAPLERKLKQRLSRGRMTADAALDLHGYRQGEAFEVLRRFLYRSQGDGARVVLVVTGKGGRPGYADAGSHAVVTSEGGVLKRSVPLWLSQPEFRMLVVGYEEAAQSHGGSGALYVRLRRRDRSRDGHA